MSSTPSPPYPLHVRNLADNVEGVLNLVRIHVKVGGSGAGRKHKVEVLNRSGIVLMVACWEAFVEDLASEAFNAILGKASDPSVFPKRVRAGAAKSLRDHKDESKVWDLAGSGWRRVLENYRDDLFGEHIGRLNTPRPERVDQMFEKLIGFKSLSAQWQWKGMPNDQALENLEDLIKLRGEISHRVTAGSPVYKKDVVAATDLVVRLAIIASNRVGTFVQTRIGEPPWSEVSLGGVK
jgi:hypothetical protein